MNPNLGPIGHNNPIAPLQNAPLQQPPNQPPQQPPVTRQARAAQAKQGALNHSLLPKLQNKNLQGGDAISRAGVKALFKKSVGEMASKRFANLASKLPGNIGKTGWTKTTSLRTVKNLAEEFHQLEAKPNATPRDKLTTLYKLQAGLNNYGDSSTRARLNDRLTDMKSYVSAEIALLEVASRETGVYDLDHASLGANGDIANRSNNLAADVRGNNKAGLDQWADDLAHDISQRLNNGDAPKFANCTGASFKEGILNELASHHPEGRKDCFHDYKSCPKPLQNALDRLYANVVNDLTGATAKSIDSKHVQIGNTQYTSHGAKKEDKYANGGALLGQGAYGKAYVFENGNNKIVVKETILPKKLTADQGNGKAWETRNEVVMHEQAQGQGCPNLVELKGHSHNGTATNLCLEFCPDGDVGDLKGEITTKVSAPTALNNLNGAEKAKVENLILATQAKDMLTGLSHMHGNGVAHVDFKGANVFMKDGTAKIGDLGTAVSIGPNNLTPLPYNNTIPDAPYYVAPELVDGKNSVAREIPSFNVTLSNSQNVDLDDIEQKINNLGDPGLIGKFASVKGELKSLKTIQQVGTDSMKADAAPRWLEITTGLNQAIASFKAERTNVSNVSLDMGKADVWALGATIQEMAYYKDEIAGSPFARNFMTETERVLVAFGAGNQTYTQERIAQWHAKNPPGNNPGQPPTNLALDNFLDRAMAPNAANRPDANTLLQDPFITQQGAGHPHVKTLIALLHDPNATQQQIEQQADLVAAL